MDKIEAIGAAIHQMNAAEQNEAWRDKRIRELEAELAALRQQQGEPVAWFQSIIHEDGHVVYSQVGERYKNDPDVFPLYREAAPRVPEGWSGMIAFLLGEAPLEGVWFGERHPDPHKKGIYWWRKNIRAMLAAAPEPNAPPPTTDTMPR